MFCDGDSDWKHTFELKNDGTANMALWNDQGFKYLTFGWFATDNYALASPFNGRLHFSTSTSAEKDLR